MPPSPPAPARHPVLGSAAATAVLLVALAVAPAACGAADLPELRPGQDFYAYANAAWLRTTSIPDGRDSIDTSEELRQRARARIAALVDGAADGTLAPADDRERQLIRLVGAYDRALRGPPPSMAAAVARLADELAAIDAIDGRAALAAALGRRLALDDGTNTRTDSVFGIWIHQDFHDPARYAVHLVQGGLGLSGREAYLDPARAAESDRYRGRIARWLAAGGRADVSRRADAVLALEREIAAAHASRADTDDVWKTDNTWRRVDFAARAPGLDWTAFFRAAGLDGVPGVVVWQPSAVIGTAALAARAPLASWKDYLWLRTVEHYADLVGDVDGERPPADGAPGPDARVRAAAATDVALAPAVGELYARRHFPAAAKARAAQMAAELRAALRRRIERASWMAPGTRDRALEKVDRMVVEVGYPEDRVDYDGLALAADDPVGNRRRLDRFEYARALARLAGPANPGEWQLAPQRVNALIVLSPNAYQFCAALLEPPFFDADGDDATNFGSAGAGMAHEFWHSFDELGHVYDAAGRLGDWWTDEDRARYAAVTAPLASQLRGYCQSGLGCADGDRVRTESVADLVGLEIALDAYRASRHGTADRVVDGLSGEQRFFVAFARRWRRLETAEAARRALDRDTHAPPAARANLVRNVDAWYAAFRIAPRDGQFLPPAARVAGP